MEEGALSKSVIARHLPYMLAFLVLAVVYLQGFLTIELPAHDISSGYYPSAETLKKSIFEYGDAWPLWTPYGFSGTPFLMKPVLGIDSLLGWLLLVIPSTFVALKLTYFLYFLLAGVFFYMFMNYLKVGRYGAFIGALVYMLNGHVGKLLRWGWLATFGGYMLLPLAMLFGLKAFREKRWLKYSVIAGIVFSVLLRFNPDTKILLWFGLLYGCYIVYSFVLSARKKSFLVKAGCVSFVILVVFFGLSAQRILPALDFIEESSRASTTWKEASSRPLFLKDAVTRLVEPFSPSMFTFQRHGAGDHIGIVAFLLLVYGLYRYWRNRYVMFFGLGALLSIFLASNSLNTYYFFWKYIPLFSSLRYLDRTLFLYAFCSSALVGFGAKAVIERWRWKKAHSTVFLGVLVVVNLGVFGFSPYIGGSMDDWVDPRQAQEDNAVLQFIAAQPGHFRMSTWETRGVDWGTDFYNVPLGLEHLFRYDTTWLPEYMNQFLGVGFNNPARFWGLMNLKYVTAREPINVTGLKFVNRFPDCTTCFPTTEPWAKAWGPYLYENQEFLPRAYVVEDAILVVGNEQDVTQLMFGILLHADFEPSRMVVVRGRQTVDEYSLSGLRRYSAVFLTQGSVTDRSASLLKSYADGGGVLMPDITAGVQGFSDADVGELLQNLDGEFTAIEDESVVMHSFDDREIALSGEQGWLVYSEKFSVFEGWDSSAEMVNANVMNTAVYLDGFEEQIRFQFRPRSYVIGSWISLITFLLLLSVLGYRTFGRK